MHLSLLVRLRLFVKRQVLIVLYCYFFGMKIKIYNWASARLGARAARELIISPAVELASDIAKSII